MDIDKDFYYSSVEAAFKENNMDGALYIYFKNLSELIFDYIGFVPPQVGSSNDDYLLTLEWSRNSIYACIDIEEADGHGYKCDCFYRDRNTGEYEGCDLQKLLEVLKNNFKL
jgi:hypothetical protein